MRAFRLGRGVAGLLLAVLLAWPARARAGGLDLIPDVPFLAQTGVLCGGASLAMILRFLGVPGVQPEDFSGSLGRDGRGILAGTLRDLAESRGFLAIAFEGGESVAMEHLRLGRPLIGLLAGPRGTYHYVVLLEWSKDRVVFHDPAFGPRRSLSTDEWRRRWRVTHEWALLVRPRSQVTTRLEPAPREAQDPAPPREDPEVVTAPAREARVAAADAFRRRDWPGAVAGARRVLDLDPGDASERRLLATSLFLNSQWEAALREWNRLAEPQVDMVRLDGLEHTSTRMALRSLDVRAGDRLTPGAFRLVERQVEALPAVASSRVTYRPQPDGATQLEIHVVERPVVSSLRAILVAAAIRGAAEGSVGARAHALTSPGERVEVSGYVRTNRSRVEVAVSTPRLGPLPGPVTIEVSHDLQTYQGAGGEASSPVITEERTRAALSLNRWWAPDTRGKVGLALDRWRDRGRYVSLEGEVEHRLFGNRVALATGGAAWWSEGRSPFRAFSVRVAAQSRRLADRARLSLRGSFETVSAGAPLALWPGAGTGSGREGSLRARPLLRGGILTGVAFAPRLWNVTTELETPLAFVGPARVTAAMFLDAVGLPGLRSSPRFVDIGVGVRLRPAGWRIGMRLDVATPWGVWRPRVSGGWERTWP